MGWATGSGAETGGEGSAKEHVLLAKAVVFGFSREQTQRHSWVGDVYQGVVQE